MKTPMHCAIFARRQQTKMACNNFPMNLKWFACITTDGGLQTTRSWQIVLPSWNLVSCMALLSLEVWKGPTSTSSYRPIGSQTDRLPDKSDKTHRRPNPSCIDLTNVAYVRKSPNILFSKFGRWLDSAKMKFHFCWVQHIPERIISGSICYPGRHVITLISGWKIDSMEQRKRMFEQKAQLIYRRTVIAICTKMANTENLTQIVRTSQITQKTVL